MGVAGNIENIYIDIYVIQVLGFRVSRECRNMLFRNSTGIVVPYSLPTTSRSASQSETTSPKLMPLPGLDILFDLLERRAQQLGFSMVLGLGPLK